MKILSLNQIKKMDQYCIDYESISSIQLMERAAKSCFEWIINNIQLKTVPFIILSGNGNNGGDGVCLARMLHLHGVEVIVYILNISNNSSRDFLISKKKALKYGVELQNIYEKGEFPSLDKNESYLVDAIFGTGYNRIIKNKYWKSFFYHINNKNKFKCVISIDIPSGLFMEKSQNNFETIIKATHTLSFQTPKLPFLFPSYVDYIGKWYLLDIGWNHHFLQKMNTKNILVDETYINTLLNNKKNKRKKFSHKGDYGHGIIIGGSYGMIGAVALSGEASLRSGIGKLTIYVPSCGYQIIQTLLPEAIIKTNNEKYLNEIVIKNNINAICIGMGMGKNYKTIKALENFLKNKDNSIPMIIDADAINILSERIELLNFIPENTIITPHPKEFSRLFGLWKNEYHKLNMLRKISKKYKIFVILKGAYSIISTPKGVIYFNTTGNPGMSTAGSGDVLSGIIMSFLSQGYSPKKSCIMGVYLHGLSGDIASKKFSQQSLISRDINKYIGEAFNIINN